MMKRGGVIAERLQYILSSRNVRIGAVGQKLSTLSTQSCPEGHQLTRPIPECNTLSAVVRRANSGCPRPLDRYIDRLQSMPLLDANHRRILSGASGSKTELAIFCRSPYGLLIPGFRVGGLPTRAAFCSEARSYATTEAVRNEGTRDRSAAGNLARRIQQKGQHESQNMLMYLVAMVVAVVGATYASVPLYRRFCQATGYGGTVQRRQTVEEKIASQETPVTREVIVNFNADVADSMPWKFTPCQSQVKAKVGQSTLAFYTAENTSSEAITGVSTYNVAPMQAGSYFNKIQCFCFEEQRLRPGEKIDMPVLFYLDPEFATDPKMDNINSLILSYTFFKVEEEEEE